MSQPLYLAFIWHMHQPYYRDLVTRKCSMPWVRLHAIKDYLDMLKRLEAFPTIHQTFNVVPSLLDQLEEYLPPANRSDEFLDLSRKPAAELSDQEQRFVLQWFFLANHERMIKPFPRYHDLLAKRGLRVAEEDWPRVQRRFRTQDYLDLQVWFNLAWVDPWLRAQNSQLNALVQKGAHFTEEEKVSVLAAHYRLIAQVIPAYREAAARGQIELTCSPYYHPILPLLCDLRSAHVALPHLPLPEVTFRYPEDARWQLQEGLARHQAAFGTPPGGIWPPEGSVSEEAARLAMEANIRWLATDEEILWRTLKTARSPSALYRPHLLRRKQGELAIVFRDRELSDLIGFVYSQWDQKIAVDDFLKRLADIHQQFRSAGYPALVSIILDGENAWEFYANDGHDFLMGLYEALASDERFRCVTVSEFLKLHPLTHAESLPELFSGSWVDANFATWIGHPEKNAAWVHLARARQALVETDKHRSACPQAWKSFGAAEGSDWMWWFGDTHFSAQAEEFDRLFRTHLVNCYQLANLAVPDELRIPLRHPVIPSVYGPTGMIHPRIDGRETSYYEWLYAGQLDFRRQYAAIHRGAQCLSRFWYGFDRTHAYLRVDPDVAQLASYAPWTLELLFGHGVRVHVTQNPATLSAKVLEPIQVVLPCAFHRILELAIPLDVLELKPEEKPQVAITLMAQGGEVLERYPSQGRFELESFAPDLEAQVWSV